MLRLRWLALTIAFTGCLLGIHVAPASALVSTLEQEMPLVVDEAARGGAVDVPGTTCTTECESLWQAERTGVSGVKNEAELMKQARNARIAQRLLPPLRVLGTIGLAAGSFELGWRIGTGIRTKILRIGLPEPPSTKAGPDSGTLWFRTAGSLVTLNSTPMPEDGWLYGYRYAAQSWESVNLSQGWSGACAYLTAPPAGLHVMSGTATNWCFATAPVESYYYPERDLPAAAPAEDDTGQPVQVTTPTWANQPQTRSDLESTIRTALGDNPLLEALMCWQLDSQMCEEPQLESSRQQCDLSSPLNSDPASSRGTGDYPADPTAFAARYTKVPASAFSPYGGSGAAWPTTGVTASVRPSSSAKVYMRYGWTVQPTGSNPNIYTAWPGWGFRHIVAKHGWSAADKAATQAALAQPTATIKFMTDKYNGVKKTVQRYLYLGAQYTGLNGAACKRLVVVDYAKRQKEVAAGQPEASMITSYGLKLS